MPGQAIYLPLGFCALVYGFQGNNEAEPQLLCDKRASTKAKKAGLSMDGHVSFATFLNLDKTHQAADPEIPLTVKANLAVAYPRLAKPVKSWTAFKTYKEMLTHATEQGSEEEVGVKAVAPNGQDGM